MIFQYGAVKLILNKENLTALTFHEDKMCMKNLSVIWKVFTSALREVLQWLMT